MLYRHSDVGSKKETEWGVIRFHHEAMINTRTVSVEKNLLAVKSEKTKH